MGLSVGERWRKIGRAGDFGSREVGLQRKVEDRASCLGARTNGW